MRPAPASAAVTEGLALVPREPTAEMIASGAREVTYDENSDEDNARNTYLAMLSAAPQPATCNQPLQVQPEGKAGADDCTPYASPAYLRGESDGVRGACARITDALEGRDSGRGVFGDADLETLRRRVLSLQAQPKPAEGGAVPSAKAWVDENRVAVSTEWMAGWDACRVEYPRSAPAGSGEAVATVSEVSFDGVLLLDWHADDVPVGTKLYAGPAADAELRAEVIALAKEREDGYAAREHGGVLNHRIADKVVELARRLAGDGGA
jgi:hypothetical protein